MTDSETIDLDAMSTSSTSPESKSVNAPLSVRKGGASADVGDLVGMSDEKDDLPDVEEVVESPPEKVMDVVKEAVKIEEVAKTAEKEMIKKFDVVAEATNEVLSAKIEIEKASSEVLKAEQVMDSIVEELDVPEEAKEIAAQAKEKAKEKLEVALIDEKKAKVKQAIAVEKAEEAVMKVEKVDKKRISLQGVMNDLGQDVMQVGGPKSTTTVQYQDVCIGMFTDSHDNKIMGVCPSMDNKCPVLWNPSQCTELKPVSTSVMTAPTTTFW